jgi:hypothetical protein
MTLGVGSWAAVSTKAVTRDVKPGFAFIIPLDLTADQSVAGINGELSFDPAKFEDPRVLTTSDNALGFIVLGNSPQPGKFRFVVYADPTALLKTDVPIMGIYIKAKNVIPAQPTETLTYTIAAASTDTGESIANTSTVIFNDVTVNFGQSGADDWAIYE